VSCRVRADPCRLDGERAADDSAGCGGGVVVKERGWDWPPDRGTREGWMRRTTTPPARPDPTTAADRSTSPPRQLQRHQHHPMEPARTVLPPPPPQDRNRLARHPHHRRHHRLDQPHRPHLPKTTRPPTQLRRHLAISRSRRPERPRPALTWICAHSKDSSAPVGFRMFRLLERLHVRRLRCASDLYRASGSAPFAARPPSTGSTTPETKLAASDSR